MRVLFVTAMHPTPGRPNQGVVIQRLARGLREVGHLVTEFEIGEGSPWRYLRERGRVRQVVRKFRPDVLHVHFGYGILAVPRLPVPIVTSFVGDDLYGTRNGRSGITLKSRLGILFSQYAAYRSSRCVVVSDPMRGRLWLRSAQARARVVRDAVDPRLFRPLPQVEARRRLGLELGAKLVLFPHDISQPNKRLSLAQNAVDIVREIDPSVRLWIVNDRPADDMPWYYAAADVMIITSVTEGGPSSAKEALACGLPVVSVPVGDVQMFAEAGDVMIRSEPTPEELAACLRRALAEPEMPRHSHLPSSLRIDQAVRVLESVYREALSPEAKVP